LLDERLVGKLSSKIVDVDIRIMKIGSGYDTRYSVSSFRITTDTNIEWVAVEESNSAISHGTV
jgi:hypothetical protein